jgi:hypothetical protein
MLARKIIVSPSVPPFSLLLGENSSCFSLNPKQSYSSVVSDICVLDDTSVALEDSFLMLCQGLILIPLTTLLDGLWLDL